MEDIVLITSILKCFDDKISQCYQMLVEVGENTRPASKTGELTWSASLAVDQIPQS